MSNRKERKAHKRDRLTARQMKWMWEIEYTNQTAKVGDHRVTMFQIVTGRKLPGVPRE